MAYIQSAGACCVFVFTAEEVQVSESLNDSEASDDYWAKDPELDRTSEERGSLRRGISHSFGQSFFVVLFKF